MYSKNFVLIIYYYPVKYCILHSYKIIYKYIKIFVMADLSIITANFVIVYNYI